MKGISLEIIQNYLSLRGQSYYCIAFINLLHVKVGF